MEKISTEILVIGAGPGGYAAAFLAADKGKNVTLVDSRATLGGVCLNEGCIPSKALLHAARIITETKEAENIGITFNNINVDIDKLRDWKDGVVGQLTQGLEQLAKRRKVQFICGTASFINSSSVKVEKPGDVIQEINFEKAIIATGSQTIKLAHLSHTKNVIHSADALRLKYKPDSLLIIGAGYIGLELGTVYAALGTKVTVADKLPLMLPGVDRDLIRVLERRLKTTFTEIFLDVNIEKIEETSNGLNVAMKDKNGNLLERDFSKVLISVGRKPDFETLALGNTRIQINAQGYIEVNAQRQTQDSNIYAIGDVTGQPLLAHKATHEGKVAVEAICGEAAQYDGNLIPYIIFTDPEIACVGLTEAQAKEKNIKIKIEKFPWAASGRALAQGRTDGVTKLMVDPESQKILGVGIVGIGAGELIMEGALAIKMGATVNDVKNLIHPHPTLSETIMDTAEIFSGTCTNLYKPKR